MLAEMPEKGIPFHEGVSLGCTAILHQDRLALSVGRHSAESIFSAVFENQSNGISQVISSFIFATALAVGSGDLGTIGDDQIAVALVDGSELVAHQDLPSRRCFGG